MANNIDANGNAVSASTSDYNSVVNGGYTNEVNYNQVLHNIGDTYHYTNFIYIPITNAEGEAMHQRAQELIDTYTNNNPGYDFMDNNCVENAQMILAAAGKDFGWQNCSWFWDNPWHASPIYVYEGMIMDIKYNSAVAENPYPGFVNPHEGYYYGRLYDNNDLYDAYQPCAG